MFDTHTHIPYFQSSHGIILIVSFCVIFQHLASTLQDKSLPRKRRHALPSAQNYKDNFGLVGSGIDVDDHVGRSYIAQNRKKKQVVRGAAPHARNVSNTYRFVMFIFRIMFNISYKIWYLIFFQDDVNEEPSNPIKMLPDRI